MRGDAMKHPFDADVLVDIRPVHTLTVPDEAKIRALTRTSWMRGSSLAAVFMPCLQNPAALRSDDSANHVQFVGAETLVPS